MPGADELIFDWCAWRLCRDGPLTKDHVFVRCVGGTREVYMPACETCQAVLSAHEERLARSVFGAYRLVHGPPPRKARDPRSGSIDAAGVFVADPLGGYGERALRVSRDAPIVLPSIQLDLRPPQTAHKRGVTPGDVDKIIEALKGLVTVRDGNTFEVQTGSVPRVPIPPGFAQDPDFWPRVFLDEAGTLRVRARDEEEAVRTVGFLTFFAYVGALDDHSKWTNGEILGGTPHRAVLAWKPEDLDRMVAKVAYGVAAWCAGRDLMAVDPWPKLRRFIIEGSAQPGVTITQLRFFGSITDWPDDHVAAIVPDPSLRALVSVHGALHEVVFGDETPGGLVLPRVAVSKRSGSSTKVLPPGAGDPILAVLLAPTEGRP